MNHLCLGLLLLGGKSVSLLVDALLSPLAGSLGLCALGIHLLSELLLAGLFGLGLVDLQREFVSSLLLARGRVACNCDC